MYINIIIYTNIYANSSMALRGGKRRVKFAGMGGKKLEPDEKVKFWSTGGKNFREILAAMPHKIFSYIRQKVGEERNNVRCTCMDPIKWLKVTEGTRGAASACVHANFLDYGPYMFLEKLLVTNYD
jgi:hypothetical protein